MCSYFFLFLDFKNPDFMLAYDLELIVLLDLDRDVPAFCRAFMLA